LCLLASVSAFLVWRFVFRASSAVGVLTIAVVVLALLSFVDGLLDAR
jgi:hypothetical protein